LSFENIINKSYIGEVPELEGDVSTDQINSFNEQVKSVREIKGKIHRNTYFDKVSDLVIEGGNTYRYHRISNDMLNEVNSNL
jgi:hypothetical protein